MTQEPVDSVPELERVTMLWPPELKEAVRQKHGPRGITEFTIGAVRTRLSDEDRVRELEKEVGELHYLCQLLADRYAMGGSHEEREAMLMEVGLPSWMSTEGWPEDMKRLVPGMAPTVTKINTPTPSQAEVKYTDEELAKPMSVVGATAPIPMAVAPGQAANEVKLGGAGEQLEQTPEAKAVFEKAGDDLFSRIKDKAAEKGVDISGAGLIPASKIPVPEKPEVHNHSFVRHDDGSLHCDCGTWIDESTKPGTLHEAGEDTTEPAAELEVQTTVPTPLAAPESTRNLDDFDTDF